jgi:hypothetical protein
MNSSVSRDEAIVAFGQHFQLPVHILGRGMRRLRDQDTYAVERSGDTYVVVRQGGDVIVIPESLNAA